MRIARLVFPVLLLLLAAATGAPAQTAVRPRADLITREEIAQSGANNAFDLIRASRPRWLEKRGNNSMAADEGIVVYMDGARLGGIDALRNVPVGSFTSVRFHNAAAANFKFGPGHRHGVIELSSRS